MKFTCKSIFLLFFLFIGVSAFASEAGSIDELSSLASTESVASLEAGGGDHAAPAAWSVAPFVILLLMIATDPHSETPPT